MSDRKSPEERSNREQPVYEDMKIYWDGEIRGPNLPTLNDGEPDWHPMTKAWWKMIRRSPQATEFEETDWFYFIETAVFHHMFYMGTYKKTTQGGVEYNARMTPADLVSLSNEIRKRIEPYGFTWAGRRKYGINVVDTNAAVVEATNVAKNEAKAYRNKLNGLT